ncbi:hypothetical protein B6N60_05141 [Richelia sinica FACHB-800]|uniref:Uncharacterized protein n=1 Tax=Richelia sinica FACHB-800 TaxID=1357546 RepID=A0A975TD46_9NOST|nr:hypothetical protein B6N60_05141 [Richelia sinica FACHB-800]
MISDRPSTQDSDVDHSQSGILITFYTEFDLDNKWKSHLVYSVYVL